MARDARIAERKAARLANKAREAAALAAAQAAAREAALRAEQEARDAELSEQTAREPPWKPSDRRCQCRREDASAGWSKNASRADGRRAQMRRAR